MKRTLSSFYDLDLRKGPFVKEGGISGKGGLRRQYLNGGAGGRTTQSGRTKRLVSQVFNASRVCSSTLVEQIGDTHKSERSKGTGAGTE